MRLPSSGDHPHDAGGQRASIIPPGSSCNPSVGTTTSRWPPHRAVGAEGIRRLASCGLPGRAHVPTAWFHVVSARAVARFWEQGGQVPRVRPRTRTPAGTGPLGQTQRGSQEVLWGSQGFSGVLRDTHCTAGTPTAFAGTAASHGASRRASTGTPGHRPGHPWWGSARTRGSNSCPFACSPPLTRRPIRGALRTPGARPAGHVHEDTDRSVHRGTRAKDPGGPAGSSADHLACSQPFPQTCTRGGFQTCDLHARLALHLLRGRCPSSSPRRWG